MPALNAVPHLRHLFDKRALERAREESQAHGEIETEHPGYLGCQDTYYVGNLKGVGRIYQQTWILRLRAASANRSNLTALRAGDVLIGGLSGFFGVSTANGGSF